MLRDAGADDIRHIALVYRRSFPDSVRQIFGPMPSQRAFADVFRFLLDELPGYFLVDEEDGKIAGYVVAPPDSSRLVRDAFLRGYVFVWAWRWLTGKYRFGFRSIRMLLSDKLALLGSEDNAREKSDSRILSIAVHPDYQGKGLGTRLSVAALERLREAGVKDVMLDVRDYNAPAIHLYEKLGFHEIGHFNDGRGRWIQMIAHLKRAEERAA